MKKTKLIIEINEEILNNPDNFPEYVFRKAVLNGKPLQAEFEEIKTEINDEEKLDLIGCGVYMGSRWSKQNTIAELEKIRDEIENHCGLAKEEHCKYCSYCNNLMGVREILEIIDKYKAESEELKGESNG